MDVDQRVREVLDRLNQNWRERHRVKDLAASVNLGPSRLTHLVRVHAQTSIRDFLRRRRIAEAAQLLITTHRRISEISLDVGFTDACNFCHVFRRELGVSPRVYRERERNASAVNAQVVDLTI
jgi:transcriptional regulator GlxA family with amidase domain